MTEKTLSDNQLLQYSRQIMMPEIDVAGQMKLLESHVLIIGVGGLGAPVAMYLAAAGIGELTLVDDDIVELSNLQRQIIHQYKNLSQSKVQSGKQTLLELNPDIKINCVQQRLTEQQLIEQCQQANIVIDCTDNFKTRYMINRASFKTQTALVSGAAVKMEGQVSVFNSSADSPCYQCLYPDEANIQTSQNCAENGVLAPLVGIIGSIQALEAIKVLLKLGESLSDYLLALDALTMQWRKIKLSKNPECPCCHG